MNSIILFYKYIFIQRPKKILEWQKSLCGNLGLKGRIILAQEGINGTLEGKSESIEQYKNALHAHELFNAIDFKESSNTANHFPRLRIVIKKEIVYLGIDPQKLSANQAGIALEPEQAHQLISQKPDNLVILDCRNKVESAIGAFENAVRPDVNHFREFPAYIDQNVELFKDKQILMYCTGGVRCERGSAYIQSKNIAQSVFHIKGGIQRYTQQFPQGYFKGKNYVFDGRTAIKVTDDILGTCLICATPYDEYTNCMRAACNKHFIGCPHCLQAYLNTCSTACKNLITDNPHSQRPQPVKTYKAL